MLTNTQKAAASRMKNVVLVSKSRTVRHGFSPTTQYLHGNKSNRGGGLVCVGWLVVVVVSFFFWQMTESGLSGLGFCFLRSDVPFHPAVPRDTARDIRVEDSRSSPCNPHQTGAFHGDRRITDSHRLHARTAPPPGSGVMGRPSSPPPPPHPHPTRLGLAMRPPSGSQNTQRGSRKGKKRTKHEALRFQSLCQSWIGGPGSVFKGGQRRN